MVTPRLPEDKVEVGSGKSEEKGKESEEEMAGRERREQSVF